MIHFSSGKNTLLNDLVKNHIVQMRVVATPSHLDLNLFAFMLQNNGKVQSDADVIFFNQTTNTNRSVELDISKNQMTIDSSKIPNGCEKIDLTLSLDEPHTLHSFDSITVEFLDQNNQLVGQFDVLSNVEKDLTGIKLCSVYLNKGQWKLKAIGQGFKQGLEALVTSYGASVDQPEEHNPQQTNTQPSSRLSLDKRIEKEAPQLLSLVKKAKLTLEKVGLQNHVAKVALCLDISGSMYDLYEEGYIQDLADKILALATRFDDDGEIDVFLFGERAYQPDPMSISDCQHYVKRIVNTYSFESATNYHEAMYLIRKHYFPNSPNLFKNQGLLNSIFSQNQSPKVVSDDCPVYVMFITDGDAHDEGDAEIQMINASYEPIFWQFMAIGSDRDEFDFLCDLDEMEGRFIDNANFFCVNNPRSLSDEKLYDLMMQEYPDWVKQAKRQGLLK